jgi:hypothetical protein
MGYASKIARFLEVLVRRFENRPRFLEKNKLKFLNRSSKNDQCLDLSNILQLLKISDSGVYRL